MKEPFAVAYAKHAESMGAAARHVESLADLEEALVRAELEQLEILHGQLEEQVDAALLEQAVEKQMR